MGPHNETRMRNTKSIIGSLNVRDTSPRGPSVQEMVQHQKEKDVHTPEGWDAVGGGREGQEGREVCISMADLC